MDSRLLFTLATVFILGGSPCFAQIYLGENVVVITAPEGASITGQVCNYSTEKCAKVSDKQGIARVALPFEHGDLVGFTGQFDKVKANVVEVFSSRLNFDWLEKVVLVLTGAIAGLSGNILMALYSDKRRDYVEQRAKFRSWRDAVLQRIVERQTDEQVMLSVDVPEGLSKKTSTRIHDIKAKLMAIENALHAQPDQIDRLLAQARELVMGSHV